VEQWRHEPRMLKFETAGRFFPFLYWLPAMRPATIKADAMAGLTVALVLIPQSMAYAQLAGLPAYYGLYAAFLPPMVAALFGSSGQLATGPVAVVSLLTAVALEPLAQAGTQAYIAFAILLAIMVGLVQFLLGVFRLGVLVNFLSHPVINGFSNAAAIIIASSQLATLFGVHVDSGAYHYETMLRVTAAAAHHLHWPTLLMGLAAFAIMVVLRLLAPHSPSVLVAVVVTTAIAWLTGFERRVDVPIEAIHVPELHSTISAYNAAIESRSRLAAQRSSLSKQQAEAVTAEDFEAAMSARHRSEALDLKLQQLDAVSGDLREILRRTLLTGISYAPDGASGFYPEDGIPERTKGDGRTWRIAVGRRSIPLDAVPLNAGGLVVGAVPRGLPSFSLPTIDRRGIRHLIPFAAIISLLGFMEAISVARAAAARTGQRIDANQELVGQGLANMAGSLTMGYPVSGSFSRTAVNLKAGGVSGFSSVVTTLVVTTALLFFTPLLYHLPQSVLAAIIMMAVMGLVNIKGFIHAWQAQWYDGAISVITFLCTLAAAPHLDKGIIVGVALSLGVFFYKSMRPTVVDLSLGVDRALHDTVSYGLEECHYIDVVRFDGPLFFANAGYLEEQIRLRRLTKKDLKHIIIAANGINDIDASGQEALSFVVERLRKAGIEISLSGVNEAVMAALKRTHLFAKIGEDHFYTDIHAAIKAIHGRTHQGVREQTCPLKSVVTVTTPLPAEEV
jgi:SulP family sulfate permease